MVIEKIDHIGIAVENLDDAIRLYTDIFGKGPDDTLEFPAENVKIAFFSAGQSSVELLQPLSQEGAIAKFISKKGQGIHHVCYRVENLEKSIEDLIGKGYKPLDEEPRNGAHETRVCFFHPKQTQGVLIELSEKKQVS